ncbi:hypothetical protein OG455_08440 [Kitasatospora sp. NBC_01287]|uniref:hypothetical protein n=1 Tax=Kitasatospora sp. NBC_01287 TaxID=2903573 RepID=UPI00224F787A|nr:hypothetical protein [Kitasatospora sp. NBC_01287]MCX4745550.1 hypothetical protein [Kitasatospora sp. NBC_01287]
MRTEREDAELLDLDVATAITRGLLLAGGPRQALFTEAAIAACHQAERAGLGAYPLSFVARHVRAGGFTAALDLREPAPGEQARELVRDWIRAAAASGLDVSRELLFARWLAQVAALIALRRRTREAAR